MEEADIKTKLEPYDQKTADQITAVASNLEALWSKDAPLPSWTFFIEEAITLMTHSPETFKKLQKQYDEKTTQQIRTTIETLAERWDADEQEAEIKIGIYTPPPTWTDLIDQAIEQIH